MLNLDEINNTIEELESGQTTFGTCQKLASLYIVREHYMNMVEETTSENKNAEMVIKEYSDILPSYSTYITAKTRYQKGEINEDNVIKSLKYVCKEIIEFVASLYSSTDMQEERETLFEIADELCKWKNKLKNDTGIELE